MADLNDLARDIYPKAKDVIIDALGDYPSVEVPATVVQTSEDGVALVDFGGETTSDDDSQFVEVVTGDHLEEGDEVFVSVKNGNPVGVTNPGWGDRVHTVASQANDIATATNQHFWTDTNGIHVTEAEGDATTEHNILINSLGILLRKAAKVLLELSTNGIIIGDSDETHLSLTANNLIFENPTTNRLLKFLFGSSGATTITDIVSNAEHVRVMNTDSNGSRQSSVELFDTRADLKGGQGKVQVSTSDVYVQVQDDASSPSRTAFVDLTTTSSATKFNIGTNKVKINDVAPFKVVSKSQSIGSVNAGAGWSVTATPTSQSGYTPSGVVGFNQTHNMAGTVGGAYLSSGTLYAYGKNDSSNNWTGTNDFTWYVLYIRSELL